MDLILTNTYKTGMTHHTGNVTASESAAQLILRIEESTMQNSGTFFHANGDVLPW